MKKQINEYNHIAFVIDEIDYNFGGTETQLVRLLDSIDKSKFRPILCCLRETEWTRDNKDKYEIYIVNFHSYFHINCYLNILKFGQFLKKKNVKYLQTYFRDGNIVGTTASILSRVEIVISTRRNMGYWYNWKELSLLRILKYFTTSYLCNSYAIKEKVISAENIDENKIAVIPNSINFDDFSYDHDEEKQKLCKELNIQDNSTIVSMVANLRPIKSIDTLIRSIKSVIDEYPDTYFLIIGIGTEFDKLNKLCIAEGVENNTLFLGGRKDVPKILSASDIGVLCSTSEGLSNSLIEYNASKLPAVYSDIPANCEAVCKECGIAFPVGQSVELGNAIRLLISDQNLRNQMGLNGYKQAKKRYDISKVTQEIENYYLSLLG